MTDDSHHDRVRRATVFLLNQVRLLDTLFPMAPDDPRGPARQVLLNADALGSLLATVFGACHATAPEVAQQWLAELLRIFEAAIQGEHDPTFVLDLAAIRRTQQALLAGAGPIGDCEVPDVLPDEI